MQDVTDGPKDPTEGGGVGREDIERPSEVDAQPDEAVPGGEMPGANEAAPSEVDATPDAEDDPEDSAPREAFSGRHDD